MGSFTSTPKMEQRNYHDDTVEIPSDLEEDQILLDWVKQQLPDMESKKTLKRTYRHAPGREHAVLDVRPIRILQWNILSQTLGTKADKLVRCPAKALDWNTRRYKILEEILSYDPDIVCLQEVDHFVFLERALKIQGYVGYFVPKPDSPCLYLPDNNGPDGCAIFYKTELFDLISVKTRILEVWEVQSNQVALLLMLRDLKSGKKVAVLSTHLKARKSALLSKLRYEQGGDLLKFIEKQRQEREENQQGEAEHDAAMRRIGPPSAIVCGDFNADPSEPVYSRILQESNLESAYASLNENGQEPEYSTWKIRDKGEEKHNLDYVFYSSSDLILEGCLEAPTEEEIGPDRVPSMAYPSDHFSLICDFSFKKEITRQQTFSGDSVRSRQ